MARASTTKTSTEDSAPVMEGQTEAFPDWATRSAEDSQVEVFGAPAANQHRRELSGPELYSWVVAQATGQNGFDENRLRELFSQVAGQTSMDALLTEAATVKGRTVYDQILRVEGIRFVEGVYPDGCPYFALLDATLTNTGLRDTVSVGGWIVIAKLGNLHYMSATLSNDSPYLVHPDSPGALARWEYPHYMKIKQGPKTLQGFHTNQLVLPQTP